MQVPGWGFEKYETSEPLGATSLGAVVTASGSTNTKGSYTQLLASTSFDAYLVMVGICSSTAGGPNAAMLLDIAIGASSDETVIIPDLMAGFAMDTNQGTQDYARFYFFPLYIPSGSRISARCQCATASTTAEVWVELWGAPSSEQWYGSDVTAYGVNTSTSGGVTLTGGNSQSEGTWASIGTTSKDHAVIVPSITAASSNLQLARYSVDVGIDTSSTSIIRSDLRAEAYSLSSLSYGFNWWPIYHPIKSGTVLAMRKQQNGTATNTIQGALYGVS